MIDLITEDGYWYQYNLPFESYALNEYYIDLNPPNIDDIKPEAMHDREEILMAYNLSKNIQTSDFQTERNAKDGGNTFLFVERNGSFIKIAKNGNSSGGVVSDSAKKMYKILSKINFFSPTFSIE